MIQLRWVGGCWRKMIGKMGKTLKSSSKADKNVEKTSKNDENVENLENCWKNTNSNGNENCESIVANATETYRYLKSRYSIVYTILSI